MIALEKEWGPNHLELAKSLEKLSDTYGVLGNIEKQKIKLEHALLIYENHLGLQHPQTALTRSHLTEIFLNCLPHQETTTIRTPRSQPGSPNESYSSCKSVLYSQKTSAISPRSDGLSPVTEIIHFN